MRTAVRGRRGACACLVVLFAFGCERHGDVRLMFAAPRDDELRGFTCREDATRESMYRRGADPVDPTLIHMNLVVDFVAIRGEPDCRLASLVDWCSQGECSSLPERACVPLQVTIDRGPEAAVAIHAALSQLTGVRLFDDAPDDKVVVRVVATAEPCESVMAGNALECPLIMACVYSCPVYLADVSEQITVDLDAFGGSCEREVNLCSAVDLSDGNACPTSGT